MTHVCHFPDTRQARTYKQTDRRWMFIIRETAESCELFQGLKRRQTVTQVAYLEWVRRLSGSFWSGDDDLSGTLNGYGTRYGEFFLNEERWLSMSNYYNVAVTALPVRVDLFSSCFLFLLDFIECFDRDLKRGWRLSSCCSLAVVLHSLIAQRVSGCFSCLWLVHTSLRTV